MTLKRLTPRINPSSVTGARWWAIAEPNGIANRVVEPTHRCRQLGDCGATPRAQFPE